MVWAIMPPIETPQTCADSIPRWSRSPKASSAMSAREYGARTRRPAAARSSVVRVTRPTPRLERPESRLSKRITWKPRSASSRHSSGSHHVIGPPSPMTSSNGSPSGVPKVW